MGDLLTVMRPIAVTRCDLPKPRVMWVRRPAGIIALADHRVPDWVVDELRRIADGVRAAAIRAGHQVATITQAEADRIGDIVSAEERKRRMRTHEQPLVPPQRDPTKGTGITMTTSSRPTIIRTDVAHSARVYDYFLGGRHNFEIDREVGDRTLAAFPHTAATARQQRAFMRRSARHIAAAGVAQFLDVGTGIPTEPNLHQVVQGENPAARVLYVDNDPIVLTLAKDLMRGTTEGAIEYLHADANDPASILAAIDAGSTLSQSEPIAVSLIGLVHFLSDDKAVHLVRSLTDDIPAGSYLSVSQLSDDPDPAYQAAITAIGRGGIQIQCRSAERTLELFADGFDLVEPGIVLASSWRPDAQAHDADDHGDDVVLGFVARKR